MARQLRAGFVAFFFVMLLGCSSPSDARDASVSIALANDHGSVSVAWKWSGTSIKIGDTLTIQRKAEGDQTGLTLCTIPVTNDADGIYLDNNTPGSGDWRYSISVNDQSTILATASEVISLPATCLPSLILSYDDGSANDYQAFRWQNLNGQVIPGEICVNAPSGILRDGEHLKEMLNAGWEIVSHGRYHRALVETPVTSSNKGRNQLTASCDPSRYGPKASLILLDANGGKLAEAIVKSYSGNTIFLDSDLSEDTLSAARFVIPASSLIDNELSTFNAELKQMTGHDINHYAYPFSAYDETARRICEKNYKSGRVIWPSGEYANAINLYSHIDPFMLRCLSMDEADTTDLQIRGYLEAAAKYKCLAILYAHTASATFTQRRLSEVLRWAKELGFVFHTRTSFFSYLDALGYRY
jgi:peptidoglycan/xylan/chitin deacetylase (PgdA/CDA1 family)